MNMSSALEVAIFTQLKIALHNYLIQKAYIKYDAINVMLYN